MGISWACWGCMAEIGFDEAPWCSECREPSDVVEEDAGG